MRARTQEWQIFRLVDGITSKQDILFFLFPKEKFSGHLLTKNE